MSPRALLLAALLLLQATPSYAFVRVLSDGKASFRSLQLLVAADGRHATYSLSARVDARAKKLVLLVPVNAVEGASARAGAAAAQAQFDALLRETGPRLESFAAKDPCVDIEDLYEPKPTVSLAEAPRPVVGAQATVHVVDPRATRKLAEWAEGRGVKADAQTIEAFSGSAKRGQALVGLEVTLPKKGRGLRLPLLTWRAPLQPLDVKLAAGQTSPGQQLTVHLLAAHPQAALTPAKSRVVDLGTGVSLPELVFEDPVDLFRAAVTHSLRRAGPKAALRVFAQAGARGAPAAQKALGMPTSALVTRFAMQLGRRSTHAPIELATLPLAYPYATRWWFRRVWRAPITCENATRYRSIVETQQRSEIMSMASLTGRRIEDLRAESAARGYLMKKDGTLAPVKIRRP